MESGQAVIKDGYIVISVAINALPAVVEGSWASGAMDQRWKVTDPDVFAKDLVLELNGELDESGTTLVHRMFDAGIDKAIEYGAEGIELHEKQEV